MRVGVWRWSVRGICTVRDTFTIGCEEHGVGVVKRGMFGGRGKCAEEVVLRRGLIDNFKSTITTQQKMSASPSAHHSSPLSVLPQALPASAAPTVPSTKRSLAP